jgi:hypothetical protein
VDADGDELCADDDPDHDAPDSAENAEERRARKARVSTTESGCDRNSSSSS